LSATGTSEAFSADQSLRDVGHPSHQLMKMEANKASEEFKIRSILIFVIVREAIILPLYEIVLLFSVE
jgi:hypothetical protein